MINRKENLFLALLILLSTYTLVLSQCDTCGYADRRYPPNEEAAKKYRKDLEEKLSDKSLDNPSDSTTDRVYLLDNWIVNKLPLATKKFYEKELFPLFDSLAKNDPYIEVRIEALVKISLFKTISPKEKYKVLSEALNDKHIRVRVAAALMLLRSYKYWCLPPNPKAIKIAKETALGLNRSDWNVKGLYKSSDLKDNPGIEDSVKNQLQRSGLQALDAYKPSYSIEYLDSVGENGSDENVRKAAKKARSIR